jgi:hypothetical protein
LNQQGIFAAGVKRLIAVLAETSFALAESRPHPKEDFECVRSLAA